MRRSYFNDKLQKDPIGSPLKPQNSLSNSILSISGQDETYGMQKSCVFDQYIASQTVEEDTSPISMKKFISIKVEVNEKKNGFV